VNAILSIIKAIPTALSIIQALFSLVKQLREMAHKKAMEDMAKAETIEEVKEALDDVAKNP
jgi:polyribonucleotide nucleotidyltransferase